jgi:hypothetical protein
MVKELGELSELEVESIEALDDNILLCKGRAAHQLSIVRLEEKTWGDEVDWKCDVCPRERYDSYDPNGDLLKRRYNKVPRSKVVGERLLTGDFRAEMFRRIKEGGKAGIAVGPQKRRALRLASGNG